MKKIITILLSLCFYMLDAKAQHTGIIQTLIITSAEHNREDYSEIYRANNARFVFYEDREGNTYLENQWRDSKSFGQVHLLGHEHYEKKGDKHSYTIYRFAWLYENSYDDNRGFALIHLTEVYDTDTLFEIKMITDTFDVSVYRGYEE